jgi:hypothetical protein
MFITTHNTRRPHQQPSFNKLLEAMDRLHCSFDSSSEQGTHPAASPAPRPCRYRLVELHQRRQYGAHLLLLRHALPGPIRLAAASIRSHQKRRTALQQQAPHQQHASTLLSLLCTAAPPPVLLLAAAQGDDDGHDPSSLL